MIENASLAHQRECRSDLGAMEQDASAFELKSPAILVIGAVGGRSLGPPQNPDKTQIAGKEKPGLSRAFLRAAS